MPTTSNMQLEVPTRGSFVGTWDTPVNGDFTIIDSAFGDITSLAASTTPVTLATSQSQAGTIRVTGTLNSNMTIYTSSLIKKSWTVENLAFNSSIYVIGFASAAGSSTFICMPPGEPVDVIFTGTAMKYKNLGRIGSYMDIASTGIPLWISQSVPPPYLNCDGSTFSSAAYPYLAAMIGTTLPDMRGNVRVAMNQGTSRLSTAVGGVDGNTLFATGGAATVTQTEAQMAAHTHVSSVTDPGHRHNLVLPVYNNDSGSTFPADGSGPSYFNFTSAIAVQTATTGITVSNATTGGSSAMNNIQPTVVGGYVMIRAG